MKHLLNICYHIYLLFLFPILSYSQINTQFFCERFRWGGAHEQLDSAVANGWHVDAIGYQGANANLWYVSSYTVCDSSASTNDHPCGWSCSGICYHLNRQNDDTKSDQALYIGKWNSLHVDDTAKLGAVYNKGCNNFTHKRAVSPVINCHYATDLKIEFDFIGIGDLCGRDFCMLIYSEDSGATWDTLMPCLTSMPCLNGAPVWTHLSINIPNPPPDSMATRDIRFAFDWQNDTDCIGYNYSFGVDNITLTGTRNCPVVSFDVSGCNSNPFANGLCDMCLNSTNPTAGLKFTNTSIPNSSISSCLWDFGDGSTSTSQDTITHFFSYLAPPNNIITLTVVNDHGCSSVDTMIITHSGSAPTFDSSFPNCMWADSTGNYNLNILHWDSCLIYAHNQNTLTISIPAISFAQSFTSETSCPVYAHSGGTFPVHISIENACGTDEYIENVLFH